MAVFRRFCSGLHGAQALPAHTYFAGYQGSLRSRRPDPAEKLHNNDLRHRRNLRTSRSFWSIFVGIAPNTPLGGVILALPEKATRHSMSLVTGQLPGLILGLVAVLLW